MTESEYNIRVTIAVPEELMQEANQLALCAGESASDDKTFMAAIYEDADKNLYSVASTVVKNVFIENATGVLKSQFDADVDMAKKAQDILVINESKASPYVIASIVDKADSYFRDHLKQLGLSLATPS